MWRRAEEVGDRDVARQMRKVFGQFPSAGRSDPETAAMAYGRLMFKPSDLGFLGGGMTTIRGEKKFLGKSYNVGLRG